ncbi:histidine kinase [Paenibacillus doosanensis]|uniref:sensor histidine kinase n=1 Tax=Paenibacillus doosanensis TaxID=1229154 RepID=UPI00217F7B2D|nr:histidine kinase [Paenibacillus doosanensis]MCS7461446.1 histidine kinase [Paenibacillus doosanensis]
MLRLLKGRLMFGSFQQKLMLSYFLISLTLAISALLVLGLNSYKQNKIFYENFINQQSKRTDVLIQDYISNISRNSYFYLTDNTSLAILERQNVEELEYLNFNNYMQRAMDQIVMLNGHIAGLSITDVNGHIYKSVGAKSDNLNQIKSMFSQEELRKGKVMVTPPYNGGLPNNENIFSIIRYLSDVNVRKTASGYVKMDVHFKAISNILGGISEQGNNLGTILMAGGKPVYNSYGLNLDDISIQSILAHVAVGDGQDHIKLFEFKISNKNYLFIARKNVITDWTIIQFIPSSLITDKFVNNLTNYSVISLISLIVAFLMSILFVRYFFKPIKKLTLAMKLVDTGKLDVVQSDIGRADEIGQLVQSYNAMIIRLRESREKEIISNHLQKRAELNMMQAQINPHFLYNTLNTIHSIARLERNESISKIAKSLSSLYRYNVKSQNLVAIGEELEQIKNYINIQQIRFPDKYEVIFDIEKSLYSYKILKFLIQPIIENSFHHGLEPKLSKGTLLLSICKRPNLLIVTIKDDGVGIPAIEIDRLNSLLESISLGQGYDPKEHVGMMNVFARIKYFYGEAYTMNIVSVVNKGTTVELVIPANEEDK